MRGTLASASDGARAGQVYKQTTFEKTNISVTKPSLSKTTAEYKAKIKDCVIESVGCLFFFVQVRLFCVFSN